MGATGGGAGLSAALLVGVESTASMTGQLSREAKCSEAEQVMRRASGEFQADISCPEDVELRTFRCNAHMGEQWSNGNGF